jgi:predicted transposase/invertase (TIGR01784 family)
MNSKNKNLYHLLNNDRDLKPFIDKAYEEGIIAARKEIAKSLKINGYSISEIATVTGLSETEINAL